MEWLREEPAFIKVAPTYEGMGTGNFSKHGTRSEVGSNGYGSTASPTHGSELLAAGHDAVDGVAVEDDFFR
jgi:hypothetical protein